MICLIGAIGDYDEQIKEIFDSKLAGFKYYN